MSFDYICASISVVPDTGVECLSQILFLIFLIGFLIIVVLNKKYYYILDWFIHKLAKWF